MSIDAETTARSGDPALFRLPRRGAFIATTGSSICRSSNSRYRSKSFICIRNASLNRSTQDRAQSFLRHRIRLARPRRGLSGALCRRLDFAAFKGGSRLYPSTAVKDFEEVVAAPQVVGKLDHLEAE